MAAHVDVERDDREFVLTIFPVESFQFREDARRDDVQSAKCQFSQVASTQFLGVGFYFACCLVGPAAQAVVLVKQEVALCLALLDQNRCQGVVLDVEVVECFQVQCADDIGIVYQKRLVTVQPLACLEDATARVEQQAALVADVQVEPEVAVLLQEVDNHLAEVVDVDGDIVKSSCSQTFDDVLQHGLACNLDHRLGTVIGQGSETGAQTCRKNQCFHSLSTGLRVRS